MSTKCTVVHGDEFHLYTECLDHKRIYLELDGPDLEFESSNGRVMVAIPIEI